MDDFQEQMQALTRGVTSPSQGAKSNPMSRVFEEAAQALGYRDFIAVGATEAHARELVPAVASGTIHLDRSAHFVTTSDGLYRVDNLPAGETIDISGTILARSRVARAGARVIIARDKPSPNPDIPFYDDVGLVRAIDAAPFATIADGANAPKVAFPFHDVLLKWGNSASAAVSFDIPRRAQKAVGGGDLLQGGIFASIIEGIILQADKVLLAAIAATAPAAFTLGAAAARNLAFGDLRALVGTNGAGAVVGQDGALRAAGVAAELTAGMAGTIVGAFGRCAVAIRPEVYFHVKRMDVNGNMNVVCFISIQGLVPDASTFWTVS